MHYWNEVAYNASGLDHTSVAPGENRVFGEQLGHCRSSRALAIVQITVFDAVNAIKGGYRSYTGLRPVREETSMDATIAHRRRMIRQTLRSGLFLKKEVNYFLAELSGKYGCHHEERNSSQAGVHRQL